MAPDTSILHRQVPLFEEQDNALYFVLGMAHLARLYLQVVDEAVSEQRPDERATPLPEAGTESLLHFLLGLRIFSNRLLTLVADMETRAAASASQPVQRQEEPIAPRQLLR